MQNDLIFGVHQLNEYVRRMLANDPMLRGVQLRGEISGYKRHISGHQYFSLKDEQSRIACVFFKQNALGLPFQPRDGMRVVLSGSVSLFVRDGSYQFYVDTMREEGLGELYLRFEQLKRRLEAEGLFDPALKKPIPSFPRTIGVVTSRTGAVLRDIVRVAHRRNPHISILLCPAAVQGEGAAREIERALEILEADRRADVILCGRGGGSMEDLWAFNEEVVARAIARLSIPVISCVGHETDFTIADFVADLRAPTPSAAAELAVPVYAEMEAALDGAAVRMHRALRGQADLLRARLSRLSGSPVFSMPARFLIERREGALQMLTAKMDAAARASLNERRGKLDLLSRTLHSLNPTSVLGRGYAVVRAKGHVLDGVGAVEIGQELEIQMRDGSVAARATEIHR